MSHPKQQQFFQSVKDIFPEHFKNSKVLDCGSLDINGSNRYLFKDCAVIGLDLAPGKNVDLVSPVHMSGFPSGYFDTIISSEAFEHDKHFTESIEAIVRMLRKGGLFTATCAGPNRPEHGTTRTETYSSPFTTDFYQNRTVEDFNIEGMQSNCFEARGGQDIYYCGIKL